MKRADGDDRDNRERDEHAGFTGPWWRFPTMRDALAAGVIAGLTWIIGHLMGLRAVEPFGYGLAMIVGGRHFFLEASTNSGTSGRSVLRSS